MATMFDPERAAGIMTGNTEEDHDVAREDDDEMMIDEDPLAEVAEDEELRPQFRYKAGYALKSSDPAYSRIHDLREESILDLFSSSVLRRISFCDVNITPHRDRKASLTNGCCLILLNRAFRFMLMYDELHRALRTHR
ncbi:hypothetical protein LB505_003288 [Fusarium chuoi]|nr:hypothetical protein LB505_003288 [Fusarium chuoi]